jgi:hypothetical protein
VCGGYINLRHWVSCAIATWTCYFDNVYVTKKKERLNHIKVGACPQNRGFEDLRRVSRLKMPPLSSGTEDAGFGLRLEARGLSGNSTPIASSITLSEGNTLQILALIFSTISVASAILAFYWFIKMRRSFRHE